MGGLLTQWWTADLGATWGMLRVMVPTVDSTSPPCHFGLPSWISCTGGQSLPTCTPRRAPDGSNQIAACLNAVGHNDQPQVANFSIVWQLFPMQLEPSL